MQIKDSSFQEQNSDAELIYNRVNRPHPKKKYRINTSRSRGQLKLLKLIIKEKGWLQVFKEGDLLWSGLAVPDEEIDIAQQLLVNRIPEMPHICHKKTMGFILNKFQQYWPEQFNFYPKTYLLPENTAKLEKKLNKGKVFIAKPSIGSQGEGIILIKKLSDLPKISSNQWVVQQYLNNPLLIQGFKFDFRMYVLISSIDPYICYLNEQGLVRLCSQQYQSVTKQNIRNTYMHLTNYSLNKNHPNYRHGDDAFSQGSKRCLKVFWKQLQKQGKDIQLLKERIIQLCVRYLTGIYPFLKYYYKANFPKKNGKCFHVIGIDILVDSTLKPWLLQANNNPSFNIEHQFDSNFGSSVNVKKQLSPVDQYVKKIIVEDTICLVNRSIQKQKHMNVGQNYYSYKKILDLQSQQIKGMNLIENMLKLFHSQCSIRSKHVLNSSQFTKLSYLNGMTSQKITKQDYHLIFIKIMREKFNSNQMDFQNFIQALEYLIQNLLGYTKQNKLNIMQDHINFLVQQIKE